jgi:hypothetical protein
MILDEQIRANPRQHCKALKFASTDVEALAELWLRGLQDFVELYRTIPESLMTKAIDAEGTNALAVGRHVMESALLDAAWCLHTAEMPSLKREVKAIMDTRAQILDEAAILFSIVPPALAALTSTQLYRQGKSALTPELILEHSIVHFYRHSRQLHVRLLESAVSSDD